jgi:hypothetical protein
VGEIEIYIASWIRGCAPEEGGNSGDLQRRSEGLGDFKAQLHHEGLDLRVLVLRYHHTTASSMVY